MKELRFHPQYHNLVLSTAEDSFNVFRPNLDPDYVEPEQPPIDEEYGEEDEAEDFANDEETKQSDSTKMSGADEERRGRDPVQRVDYELESDEDMDAENDRLARTSKQLSKNRAARSRSKAKKRS